jgi:hypothetical protein
MLMNKRQPPGEKTERSTPSPVLASYLEVIIPARPSSIADD